MMNILAFIWCGIIAFGVIMYVILGGFDLGVGIMSIFFKDEKERDLLMSAILPMWDGNQTWLVFGGATLYGAFPAAFSMILPIMYIPILIMVIALLFRGVAFEFRLKAIKTKRLWELCIFLGSVFATLAQGLILGTFVRGFNLSPHVAKIDQWFNPFGIACAIALVFGYVLLGANFLIIKTSGELQEKNYKLASKIQYIILAAFIMVSIWSPFLDPAIRERWFDPNHMLYLAILPFVTLLLLCGHWVALKKKQEYLPFWSVIGMFLMCYLGFIISSYPYIVPRQLTYMEAAADRSSLLFMLVGACVMLPPLLYYTYYSYRIFRGKVTQIEY
ncbi:MAG: cydB [Gammaproteobacteria bacterium]|jgi:cytochrome d ubiquinol oxidase subunit II|nr:cydB [Gammaproteobacteria bacterium]